MLPNLFGSAAVTPPSALRGGGRTDGRSGNTERPAGAGDFSALVDRAARARDTRSVHDGRPAEPARPSPLPAPRGTPAGRPASHPASTASGAKAAAHPASRAARTPAAGQAESDTEPMKTRESDESKTVDVAAPVDQVRTPVQVAATGGGTAAAASGPAMPQADAAGEAGLDEVAQPGSPDGTVPDTAAQAAPEGAELAADAFAELDAEPNAAAELEAEPPADAARAAANAARLARLISQSGGGAAESQSEASRVAADAAGRESVRPAMNEDALSGLAADQAPAAVAGTAAGTTAGFASDERQSGSGGSSDQRPATALHGVQAPGAATSTFTLAAPAVAQTAAALPQPPGPETMNQLVQSMRTQFRNGIGEAVVRLNPDHLGAVSISLRVERGTVTASVAAESPSVRAWLESQEQTLRQSLAGQGLNLDRLVVHPDERDQARQQDEAAPKRRQPRNAPDPDAPVFEIIV